MNSLLSFVGGLGSGYLGQTEKNRDRARQERLDAQDKQMFDARMAQTQLQTAALTRADQVARAQADALEGINQYVQGNEAAPETRQSFQDATGLSKDSTALLASKTGGYGGGTTGLQAAAGDVALEARRLRPAESAASKAPAVAMPADVTAPMPATMPPEPSADAPAAAPSTSAPVAAAAQAAPSAATTAAAKTGFSSSVGGLAAAAGAYTQQGLLEREKKYHLLSGDMNAANATQEKIKALQERDADVSAYGRIGKMTNAQLFAEYGKQFNENRNLDGDVSLDAVTGKLYIKPYDPAKPAFEVPRSTLEQAAFTVHRIGRGDVAAGMATLGALDQGQRQLVGGYSAQRMAIAKAMTDQAEGAAKTNYYNSFAAQKDALAANGGTAPRSARADHFDEKQWDAAAKIDRAVVSLPNELSGKDMESVDLRSTYMRTFNNARADGTMSPNEAAEHAVTTIGKIKSIAADRVERAQKADPKSKLTLDGAIKEILKESASFQPKPAPVAPAAKATGPTNATEADMKRNVQLSPSEQARSNRIESNPKMLAEIDREIANTRAPESLRILREERVNVQRRIAANSVAQ